MKTNMHAHLYFRKVFDIISFFDCLFLRQKKVITCFFNRLGMPSYNLFTGFPQNLWKTSRRGLFLRFATLLVCCTILASCSFFKSTKKDASAKPAAETAAATETKPVQETKTPPPADKPKKGFFSFLSSDDKKPFLDNSLIDQGEDEVKKRFGEPDVVAKTPENLIIWTYKPKWKLMPDNADTVYVEFDNGKVRKIVRATR
jgi:hypothetical protein